MHFAGWKGTRIYFLHIPKTAGSSVSRWLSKQVGEEKTCPAKIWDQIISIERTFLQKYT
jgi:hypothetical protein